jgi:hypothetical protein
VTLEEARVRLEGALERLESLEPRMGRVHALLASRSWRTQLIHEPELLPALGRDVRMLDDDLDRARQLLRREPAPELDELVHRVSGVRELLLRSARERVGRALDLPALLEALQERAAKELPLPIAKNESVVLVGHTGLPGRWGGRYALTTRRLVIEPARSDPHEVALLEVAPGSVRRRLWAVELKAGRTIRVRWPDHAEQLARQIELERWLTTALASPPGQAPRWNGRVYSCTGYRQSTDGLTPFFSDSLVLSETKFVLIPRRPNADVSGALGPVFGAVPRVSINLRQLCDALRRCAPEVAEKALARVGSTFGVKLTATRRVLKLKGEAINFGFEGEVGVRWVEQLRYRDVKELEALLSGWERQEVINQDGVSFFTA